MTSKYQEAKNYLKKFVENKSVFIPYFYDERYKDSVDTLQELIDNYEKSLRLCVMETKEKVILEKALDLACEELFDFVVSEYSNGEDIDGSYPMLTKEQWKEYLLQGGEEE